jgi:DNA-binding XRE family transcriptional regulator
MNYILKIKILQSGKPQIAVAREIGISEPYLSKIVNEWIEPKAEMKNRIAQVLNCQIKEIFPQTETASNG